MVPLRGPVVSASGTAWRAEARIGQAASAASPAPPATTAAIRPRRDGAAQAYRRDNSATTAPAVAVPSNLIWPATATPTAATPRLEGLMGRNSPNTTANAAANTQGASANPLVRYLPADPAAAVHSSAATTAAATPATQSGTCPVRRVAEVDTRSMAVPRATRAQPLRTPTTICPSRNEAALPTSIPLATQPMPAADPISRGGLGPATPQGAHPGR